MELDEMKRVWQSLNQRMEQQHALSLRLFRDGRLEKVNRRLRPLRWGQRFQIVCGGLLMLLSAAFWSDHTDNFHLMVDGLMLHAYGLLLVLTAARNLYLQSRLDFAAPVVEIQKRLATLWVWRLREAVLYGVTGCFIWIPLVLVLFALVGADVWVYVPSIVVSFLASGVACLGVMYGLIRWSQLPGHARLRAVLLDSSIGRSVRDPQSMLDEIARFEQA